MLSSKLTLTVMLMTMALLTGLTTQAQADDLYQRTGVVDARKPEKGSVIIYDVEYTLDPATIVYLFDNTIDNTKPELRQRSDQKHLTPGTRVGYTVTYASGTQQAKITEIWILPTGTVAASEEEG